MLVRDGIDFEKNQYTAFIFAFFVIIDRGTLRVRVKWRLEGSFRKSGDTDLSSNLWLKNLKEGFPMISAAHVLILILRSSRIRLFNRLKRLST